MVKPHTNQWKGNSYHEALQSTNDSNNKIDNTSDSNVNSNVSDSLEFLNSPTNPRQLTTLLLTTKHCDSEIGTGRQIAWGVRESIYQQRITFKWT